MKLDYFKLHELVPKDIIQSRGEAAIELMDPRILYDLDTLRGSMRVPMTVNTVSRQSRGLRTPSSQYYSPTSQHTSGRAVDAVSRIKPEEFHYEILTNPHWYASISFLEIDITWLHIDCRYNADGSRIRCWSPSRGFVDPEAYLGEIKTKLRK